MKDKKMPVIFSGHGDPMIALADNDITAEFQRIGQKILDDFGRPKAILAISAHWYTHGTFIQSEERPRQIYDMYGFPKELYEVKYPVAGSPELAKRVTELLAPDISTNNSWGIDHGTWTVLIHFFPSADIPVVQLSVNGDITPEECYELGRKLSPLRDEGILIFGSGNVVHNLRRVDWDNPGGSVQTDNFNKIIIDAVSKRNDAKVTSYSLLEYASYAVPTPEHFLPLLYILGAADKDERAEIFNNVCNLGAIAMTGFAFGL